MSEAIHNRRKFVSSIMTTVTAACAIFAIAVLILILSYIAYRGIAAINWEFIVSTPKPVGEGGGIGNAIAGSAMMTLLASLIGLPIGIGAGVYLAEFGDKWYGNTIRFLSDTLIGVPSIIVGIFIYTLIVLPMQRQSGLAGAIALAIIMIPIVARTTEEMIRLVPKSMREGALALGAPQWRVTWDIVMPAAASGIATGAMLSIARISGETAPLLFTALNSRFYNWYYDKPMSSLTVQIYNFATGPFEVEHQMAWAATLILVGLILVINIIVRIFTRKKF
ncbi:MAG: phosphate ABC transporter permease PstA [Pyrinomonadaceae bacterium]|nr:phosphate ABC transporter permease PstA [Pyrinomonadaceae bacterium]